MLRIPPGRWEGVDGMGDELFAQQRLRAESAVLRAGLFFETELVKTLKGKRSGRVYLIGKNFDITHVASAPGEAPAVLYGRLWQSIDTVGPTWDGNTVTCDVGTNVVYARRLEFGGAHTQRRTVRVRGTDGWFTVKAGTIIRIAPRPWMEPTVLRVLSRIERILQGAA